MNERNEKICQRFSRRCRHKIVQSRGHFKLRIYMFPFSIYGKKIPAVRGVSFDVGPWEAVGMVGESGSGKSATVQAIMRLSPAEIEGNVFFMGQNLTQITEREMRNVRGVKVGMVFQDPMSALNPTMTIGAQSLEGLIYHNLCSPKEAKERAIQLPSRCRGSPIPKSGSPNIPIN